MPGEHELSASLTFKRGSARVSLERVALLKAVHELGSITAAAKALGLSYRAAWDGLQALNNLFDGPLVDAAPGGKTGGVAVVTPLGTSVLIAFGRVGEELEATLSKLDGLLGDEPARDLFWSLGMRTSARNALRGVITHISPGAVSAEVTLKVAEGVTITAMLTRQSVEDLDLSVGRPAIALIKASFVVLARGEGLRTSARNQIAGVVAAREDGAVNSEIALSIGGGKTLIATVTLESARNLELAPGLAVTALVKAPHVILAVE
jgi:molybdate transport system regulatory protein